MCYCWFSSGYKTPFFPDTCFKALLQKKKAHVLDPVFANAKLEASIFNHQNWYLKKKKCGQKQNWAFISYNQVGLKKLTIQKYILD